MSEQSAHGALAGMLRNLRLTTMLHHSETVALRAEHEGWSFGQYLRHLCELELQERTRRRTERNLKASKLPPEKTFGNLQRKKLSVAVNRQVPGLCEGHWLERGDNLLVFGLPGRGKTHLVSAIGHELIQRGRRVLFVQTYALVQQLLSAKRDLKLERTLGELDNYELVILDDLGYVQQSREEMEVLFTFFAERYERKSTAITSNLVFSEWTKIFKDPMTTAAAIDRLVHHSIILELNGKSIREEAAEEALRTTITTTTAIPTTTTQASVTQTTTTQNESAEIGEV